MSAIIESDGKHQLHLFLSPHLDDAVLSCGGQIHSLCAAGHSVVVYTVMAGKPQGPLPESPILSDLHARWGTAGNPVAERRGEDIKALRRLGAVARHGALLDCVYRVRYTESGEPQALYPSEQSLWGEPVPDDPALALLEALPLLYPQADAVHVPLGAGGHVDHRLVRDWGRRLARANPELAVYFYEEYPYSRHPDAVQRALRIFDGVSLMPTVIVLDEAALHAKIEAIACYESQISTFWPDIETMAKEVRAAAEQTGSWKFAVQGVLAEREWRPGRA